MCKLCSKEKPSGRIRIRFDYVKPIKRNSLGFFLACIYGLWSPFLSLLVVSSPVPIPALCSAIFFSRRPEVRFPGCILALLAPGPLSYLSWSSSVRSRSPHQTREAYAGGSPVGNQLVDTYKYTSIHHCLWGVNPHWLSTSSIFNRTFSNFEPPVMFAAYRCMIVNLSFSTHRESLRYVILRFSLPLYTPIFCLL